jgi:peptide/nickel transport system permease protein
MYAVITRRLLTLPIMIILATFLVYLLPYLSGLEPAEVILRTRVGERELSDEVIEAYKQEMGLDQPLIVQYVKWLSRLLQGDLGVSYVGRISVAGILLRGFKVTVVLALFTVMIAFIIAIPLGVLGAIFSESWIDNLVAAISQIGVAIPEYFIASILILVFALYLGWFPSAGWDGPRYVILPIITISLRPIAYFTRLTRASMIEVMNKDFIRASRAKGLTEFQTIWRHALRNSLIPIVTYAAMWLASLLGGVIIIEVIFAIPGIGRTMYQAVLTSDFPLLQAGLVILVSLTVIINALTDLVYIVLNPAISLESMN